MLPRKIFFQTVGIICIILAISGALMYPLNTYSIMWVILYETVVILGSIGIIFIIYYKGFEK